MEKRKSNIIGRMLERYRERYGLTQQQLCERLQAFDASLDSVTPVTISRWENGVTAPRTARKQQLLRFFTANGALQEAQFYGMMQERYCLFLEPMRQFYARCTFAPIVGCYPALEPEDYRLISPTVSDDAERYFRHIVEFERASLSGDYYSVSAQQLENWCRIPGTHALVCERMGQHMGHAVLLKISDRLAEAIAHGRRREYDIASEELLAPGQRGSCYFHALYGNSPYVTALMNVHAYLYLLEHYADIERVLIVGKREGAIRMLERFGIGKVAEGRDERCGLEWAGFLSPVEDILFSEAVVDAVF